MKISVSKDNTTVKRRRRRKTGRRGLTVGFSDGAHGNQASGPGFSPRMREREKIECMALVFI